MPRRTSLVLLLALQTATLVGGATAALARPSAPHHAVVVAEEREPVLHATGAAVHLTAPRPKRVAVHHTHRTVTVHRTRHVVRHRAPALTPEQRMMRAVSHLVGYRSGDAVWAISSDWGHWGMADLYGGVVYISPTVPADRMFDVVAHEWSHLLMVKAYGGDVPSAMAAANAYFGGSDLQGSERAADCMARLLGATWTHYTSCASPSWRAGARRLLAREQI